MAYQDESLLSQFFITELFFIYFLQFLNLLLTVSGKDLSHFLEQWVCRSGVACFHSSFTYVRKKNMVELQMSQDSKHGYSKFVVSNFKVTMQRLSEHLIIL